MKTRLAFAALAAAVLGLAAPDARADIVILTNGKVLPSRVKDKVKPGEYPSTAALRASGRSNLELNFDRVKIGSESADAAQVSEVYCTKASGNESFSNGLNQGEARFWSSAYESFNAAASELEGADKQVAMWFALEAARASGKIELAETAVRNLLTAFPQGYYAPQARVASARILLNQRRPADAKKALQAVFETPKMNARDKYAAAVNLIAFFERGKKPASLEKAYRDLVGQIKAARATTSAAVPYMKALVGVGTALIRQGDARNARPIFKEAIDSPAAQSDRSLLAAAYKGLGDATYIEVAEAKKDAKPGDAGDLVKQLDDAVLHYLRVIHFYRAQAGDVLQPAYQSCAQALEWQFDLAGKRDAEALALAKRAFSMYAEAHKRMGSGEAKRQLTAHIRGFIDKRDELAAELQGDTGEKADEQN